MKQVEYVLRLLIGDDELDFNRQRSGQFEELGFIQLMMTPKPPIALNAEPPWIPC